MNNPVIESISTAATNHQNQMKAIVQDEYGASDVLALREIERPVVEADEVLVVFTRQPPIQQTGIL